jgi:thioredoxin 1
MNRQVFFSFVFLLMIGAATSVRGGAIEFTPIASQAEWDSVLAVSKSTGRPVFLDISTTWCGFCRKLHRNVYTDTTLSSFFNTRFINISLDGDHSFGKVIGSTYGVRGYPSLLFLNHEGGLLHRVNGYVEVNVLLSHGRRVAHHYSRETGMVPGGGIDHGGGSSENFLQNTTHLVAIIRYAPHQYNNGR